MYSCGRLLSSVLLTLAIKCCNQLAQLVEWFLWSCIIQFAPVGDQYQVVACGSWSIPIENVS